MKLDYDDSIPGGDVPLVMLNGDTQRRVEIHIRIDGDRKAILFACMGRERKHPEEIVQLEQGPYESIEHAVGAKRAIASQLRKRGFEVRLDLHSVWEVQVQKNFNKIRQLKSESKGNYKFSPKDVFLDW